MSQIRVNQNRNIRFGNDENFDTNPAEARSAKTDHAVVGENLQHRRYGGFHFITEFFGWLVSTGMAAILVAILAAAGTAAALTRAQSAANFSPDTANTIGLTSGIVFIVVLALSYYAGGYVAGRMARFDGFRQGLDVWLMGVLVTLLVGGAGAALGAKYNVLQQLNLPNLPVDGSSFTRGGLVTTIVTFLATLLAAVTGGKAGEAYHRKVDEAGTVGRIDSIEAD